MRMTSRILPTLTALSIAGVLLAARAAPPVATAPTVAPPPAPAATPTAEAPQATEAPTITPTEAPAVADTTITLTDALGREVTLTAPPQRIVLAGLGLFMIADAIYTFPEAGQRIAGMGQTAQGSGNFIKLIDPGYADKATLKRDAGATWLTGRMHPDRFPNLDIEAEAKAFYQTLYGLDADFFASKIKPTFKGDLP